MGEWNRGRIGTWGVGTWENEQSRNENRQNGCQRTGLCDMEVKW